MIIVKTTKPRALSVSAPSAASRFGGFKPDAEGPQPLRELLVEGSELNLLRDKREMLRTMTPRQALDIFECHDRLNILEILALAKETGGLIASSTVLDRVLGQTEYDLPPQGARGLWTGTAVIFEAPGKHFGDTVVYSSEPFWKTRPDNTIEFSVPEKFQGKVNCALVVEHPDFELIPHESGGYRLIVSDESMLSLVERFPRESGWHAPDAKFGIPCGAVTNSRSDYRYLKRNSGPYVGFLVRGFTGVVDYTDTSSRGINAECSMLSRLGVVLI